MKGTLKKVMKQFDYQTYGGVPLLGVNGVSIIGHGSSTPLAVKNMIFQAGKMCRKNLVSKIENSLKDFSTNTK
jgi:glycerol-3-phosphate acyltransferase PlsX